LQKIRGLSEDDARVLSASVAAASAASVTPERGLRQ
jgi:hypothetical protein